MEDAKLRREQFFALGIVVGAALGVVIGSMIALRLGDEGVDAIRRALANLLGHEDEPKFEYLLQ